MQGDSSNEHRTSKLRTLRKDEENKIPRRVTMYKLVHKEAGRGGTWLTLSLKVTKFLNAALVKVEIPDLFVETEDGDVEAALDKLAEWMERASKELRARGKPAPAVAYYPEGNP